MTGGKNGSNWRFDRLMEVMKNEGILEKSFGEVLEKEKKVYITAS